MNEVITATRSHEICAGHRVVNQGGHCENWHGHNFVISFTVEAQHLNVIGMVLDFGVIKTKLCEWLENNWDHKYLLWENDPWINRLGYGFLKEMGVVRVPFNPTAENIGLYLLNIVGPQALDGTNVILSKVIVQETSKCYAEVRI